MKNKIDSYFKKNLDVPQQPPADAWEYIQNRIPQKEKKRIFPFWAKLSGIAALLLMMISGGYMSGLFESGSWKNSVQNSQNTSVSYQNSSEIETLINQLENEDQSDYENESSIHYLVDSQPKTFSYEQHSNHQNFNNANNSNFLVTNSKSNSYSKNSTFYNSSGNSNSDNSNSTLPTQGQNEINDLNNSPQIAWSPPVWDPEIPILKNEQTFDPLNSSELENTEKEDQTLLALNSKENKKKKSKNDFKKKPEFDRFYIAGFISPMALNSFVGNSMLSDEMSEYKTENNVTLAYGVKGAYALSPRVKVRTGVSVVGFEQITKNVSLSASVDQGSAAASLRDAQNNVKYHGDLRIENQYAASLNGDELNNRSLTGDIQQQSQYIEIPVEAEVALFQTNSIGISATAGGSTWLLSKNKIYAHTDDYTEELGKADNLNNTSFSANAGLKFDMKISDKVQVNVEPGFKYLINPVSDIEKYNPYTVGVNAGITVSLK